MLEDWGFESEKQPEEFVYVKPKVKNPFDIMNTAFNKKFTPTLQEKQSINEFLFHNILSNDPKTIELALMFTTRKIPVERQYDIVRAFVPKCYIGYPSKKKEVKMEDVEMISDYYNCNMRVAEEYLELMTPDDVQRIRNKYTEGKI